MKSKIAIALLAVALLAGCAKTAVKPQSGKNATGTPSASSAVENRSSVRMEPAAAPIVSPAAAAAPAGGNAGATSASESKASAASPAGAHSSAASTVPATPGAAANASKSTPGSSFDSILPPPAWSDDTPGHVAAAQPLEGIPPSAKDAGKSAQPVAPNGPAAGELARRSIFFDYDSFTVAPEYLPVIEAHAKFLADHPGAHATVEGNADERGSSEYNLALGQKRADEVGRRLNLWGAPNERIEDVSFGKERPRNPGHDETAWRENRRVDIVYRGER